MSESQASIACEPARLTSMLVNSPDARRQISQTVKPRIKAAEIKQAQVLRNRVNPALQGGRDARRTIAVQPADAGRCNCGWAHTLAHGRRVRRVITKLAARRSVPRRRWVCTSLVINCASVEQPSPVTRKK